ncbi:MAG: 4-hydroxythreonine-4-phosphate dehydrogenase PdxA [Desulfamplus sp.]|nr:4-hydroxythreonine-4-phosphate dehydrogenase PdxA [Desulfamplus sp.]MBF0241970.1 4-hydroxythreonine-4-phosphate dehydrogenase PdxA [Desulfamplus sp.]
MQTHINQTEQNRAKKQQLRPLIGITMGDPAGIGPEVIVGALSSDSIHYICRAVVFGDFEIMKMAVKLKNSNLKVCEIDGDYDGNFSEFNFCANTIYVLNLSSLEAKYIEAKNISATTGLSVINYINRAVDFALNKKISAMVTAPITKTALKMAGSQFHGHTELIAHRTGTKDYAMMLAGDRLKVVLVTIHIALSEVPKSLTVDNIVRTIKIAGLSLKRNFAIKEPRIAVAGLNPHSGEDGMFGDEEIKIITPAVEMAKELLANSGSFQIDGPFPPDTIFYNAANGNYDCVICMYHDQGLIPFKLLHFSDGVNTTLGLPIIRTSVDHGTAYNIAWKNRADHTSLFQAIKMAVVQADSLQNSLTV